MFEFELQLTRPELHQNTSGHEALTIQPSRPSQLELGTDGRGSVLTRLPQPLELPPPLVVLGG